MQHNVSTVTFNGDDYYLHHYFPAEGGGDGAEEEQNEFGYLTDAAKRMNDDCFGFTGDSSVAEQVGPASVA